MPYLSELAYLAITEKHEYTLSSGGSKGGMRDACPPLAQNFFIFMQFLGKIGQIIGWRPSLGLAPPSLGNPESATVQIPNNNVSY